MGRSGRAEADKDAVSVLFCALRFLRVQEVFDGRALMHAVAGTSTMLCHD